MLTTQSKATTDLLRRRQELLAGNVERARYKQIPYRPAWEVLPDGAWRGDRCFIVGGGPSLSGFDFERLRGRGRVVAINASYLDIPFADALFFMDGSKTTFYGLVHDGGLRGRTDCMKAWAEFAGVKVFLNLLGRKYEDVHSVRSLGRRGLSRSLRNGLYHGNNSGIGAVGLAVCLGADPIYLLGIDCKFSGGRTHYHGGYPRTMPERVFESFAAEFDHLGKLTKAAGIRVVNLNPDSGVRCFPFSTIDEVLGDGR